VERTGSLGAPVYLQHAGFFIIIALIKITIIRLSLLHTSKCGKTHIFTAAE
jgi:hypothetical protein